MALPDPLRSWALLIGTSKYPQDLENLPAVEQNLKDLRRVLTDPNLGGLPPDHCHVIVNPSDERTVAEALDQLGRQATDTLIVYYAGHGLLDESTNLYLGLTTSTRRLVVADSMPFDVVRIMLRRSRARARILILDCCYSGRAIGTMGAASTLAANQISIEGTYTLTSSAATRTSLAPPGSRLTAFTDELLRILKHGRPDGPPELDMHTIYIELKESLTARGLPEPQQRADNTAHQVALVKNIANVSLVPRPLGPAATAINSQLDRPRRRRVPKRSFLSDSWLDQIVAWAPLDGRNAGIEGTYTVHLPDRNRTFSFVVDDHGHLVRAYRGGSAKATASTNTTPADLALLLRASGDFPHNDVLKQRNYPLWVLVSVAPTSDRINRFTRWPRSLIEPRRTRITMPQRRAALILLPVLALEIASVVGLVRNLPSEPSVDTSLAAATVGPQGIISALQNERDWATLEQLGMQDRFSMPVEGYEASRAWTDRAFADLRPIVRGLPEAVAQEFERLLGGAEAIDQLRRDVDGSTAPSTLDNFPFVITISHRYSEILSLFLDLLPSVLESADDTGIRHDLRVSEAVSQQIENLVAIENQMVSFAALSPGGVDTPSEISDLGSSRSNFAQYADQLASWQDDYDVPEHELSEVVRAIDQIVETAVSTGHLGSLESWFGLRNRAVQGYVNYLASVDATMTARVERINDDADARLRRSALLALAALVGGAICVLYILYLRNASKRHVRKSDLERRPSVQQDLNRLGPDGRQSSTHR